MIARRSARPLRAGPLRPSLLRDGSLRPSLLRDGSLRAGPAPARPRTAAAGLIAAPIPTAAPAAVPGRAPTLAGAARRHFQPCPAERPS